MPVVSVSCRGRRYVTVFDPTADGMLSTPVEVKALTVKYTSPV